MSDVWAMIGAERRGLADELEGLDQLDWDTPSLCTGWSVRHVVAHLVWPLETSLPVAALKLIANRFDFNRMSARVATGERRSGPELLVALRAHADDRFTPPGFGPEAPLTDLVIHGQDIRRPLGSARQVPPDRLRVALDLLVSPKAARGFVPKGRLDDLEFRATDLDWSHGSGAELVGPAEALAGAIAGRPVALDDLGGAGVETLRSRLD